MITFTGFSFVRPLIFWAMNFFFFWWFIKRLVTGWIFFCFGFSTKFFSTVAKAQQAKSTQQSDIGQNEFTCSNKKKNHKGKKKSMTLKGIEIMLLDSVILS